jgi:general stress protein 26
LAKKGGDPAGAKDGLKRLRKLIKNTRIAMFTTVAGDGTLRSRPMATLKAPFEGDLWFLTRATAPKTDEIRENQHVNVAYVDADGERFVSISGAASLVRDPEKVAELWTRRLRSWFPQGKKDPDLALIRVRVAQAEWWDAKRAAMVHLDEVPASGPEDERRGRRKDGSPAVAPTPPVTAGA